MPVNSQIPDIRLLFFTCTYPDLDRYQRAGDECDYGALIDNGWCYSTDVNDGTFPYVGAVGLCRGSGGDLVSIHDANVSFLLNSCYWFKKTVFFSTIIARGKKRVFQTRH